jgi:hypothetical protein
MKKHKTIIKWAGFIFYYATAFAAIHFVLALHDHWYYALLFCFLYWWALRETYDMFCKEKEL